MPHTPGPWSVGGNSGTETKHPELTIESEYGQVATVFGENCDIDAQIEADARLIAMAPVMLDALENAAATLETVLIWFGESMPETDRAQRWRILGEAKSAAAKARGA
jgi:hypothetical protein